MDMKIGQLGAGYWGPNLIRNFIQLDEVERVVVCDHDDQRLERVRRLYNGKIVLQRDERALIEDPEIESGKRLSLPVSVSPEYNGSGMNAWGRDASFQLAAFHFLAPFRNSVFAPT